MVDLAKIYESCSYFQVVDALLRESRKEKIAYKLEALKCLGEVLEKFSIDKFTDVFSILSPILIKVRTKDSTYLSFSFPVATSVVC